MKHNFMTKHDVLIESLLDYYYITAEEIGEVDFEELEFHLERLRLSINYNLKVRRKYLFEKFKEDK